MSINEFNTLKQSLDILGLNENYNNEQLQFAYENKILKHGENKIIKEAYKNLKLHIDTINKINEMPLEELLIKARIRNILEVLNLDNGGIELYIRRLKKELRDANFDYYNNEQEALENWTKYSIYKDGSDYLRNKKRNSKN